MELSESIQQQLPELLNTDETIDAATRFDTEGTRDPLDTVLLQEMDRYNRLLVHIRESCVDVSKAVQGMVVMSEALDAIYQSFISNHVPKAWEVLAYPSLHPLNQWLEDLFMRIAFHSRLVGEW